MADAAAHDAMFIRWCAVRTVTERSHISPDTPSPVRHRLANDQPMVRPPGRPRDARRDDAIISATLQALADTGFTGLSMEAVASRAGVGKATVYRRWSTKDALVADALATLADMTGPVDTGSLRDDLLAWLDTVRKHNIQTLSGRIMPRLLAEKESHPDLFDTYRRRVIAPMRTRIGAVLRRGIDNGEVAEDVDVEIVTDLLLGALAFHQFISVGHDVSEHRVRGVVDSVLRGILVRDGAQPPRPDTALDETAAQPA